MRSIEQGGVRDCGKLLSLTVLQVFHLSLPSPLARVQIVGSLASSALRAAGLRRMLVDARSILPTTAEAGMLTRWNKQIRVCRCNGVMWVSASGARHVLQSARERVDAPDLKRWTCGMWCDEFDSCIPTSSVVHLSAFCLRIRPLLAHSFLSPTELPAFARHGHLPTAHSRAGAGAKTEATESTRSKEQ